MDKNKIIPYAAAAGFVVVAICMFLPSKKEKDEKEEIRNEVIELPDGNVKEVTDSKSEGYQMTTRNSAASEYWRSRTDSPESPEEIRENSERMFGKGSGQTVATYQTPASGNPYRETAQEREERHRRRHEEAIELAERMTGEETATSFMEETQEEERRPEAVTRKSAAITSLDDGFASGGVSSLDDDESIIIKGDTQPIRCMFARNSKVRNGQRVSVILLEDIIISGISVPKNSHLMATCRLSDRLELDFENIEIGGRILHLGYEAYDVDGSRGIYCPDMSGTGRQVRSRGSNVISSTLTGRMGRIAGEVVSSGLSIAQNAGGEVTVNVPAGYTFYIVKTQK